jgi:hypothetical protein
VLELQIKIILYKEEQNWMILSYEKKTHPQNHPLKWRDQKEGWYKESQLQ